MAVETKATVSVQTIMYFLKQISSFSLIISYWPIIDIRRGFQTQPVIQIFQIFLELYNMILERYQNARVKVVESAEDKEIVIRRKTGCETSITDIFPVYGELVEVWHGNINILTRACGPSLFE